jgi:uncharacterized membrane protein
MSKRKFHSAGNNKKRSNNNRFRNSNNDSRNSNIIPSLPSPTILQEYEYATEGAADRILQMAEIEQDSRNDWENDYLQYYKKSLRIGQLFGFILLLAVIAAYVYLSKSGFHTSAFYLAGVAFGSVAISSVFASLSKGRSSKRPYKRR